MTENEKILAGCLKKDPASQKALYDKYSAKCFSVCLRYASDYEEAHDLFVEGFIKVYEKIETFNGNSSLLTWMKRIFVNTAIDHLRSQTRRREHIALMDRIEMPDMHTNMGLNFEMADLLDSGLRSLSPTERTVVNMIAVEGYQAWETASSLHLSIPKTKHIYYNALQKIRQILGETLGNGDIDNS